MRRKPEYLIYGILQDEYGTKPLRILSYVDLIEHTYGDIRVSVSLPSGVDFNYSYYDYEGNFYSVNVSDKCKTVEFTAHVEDKKLFKASCGVFNKIDKCRVVIKNGVETIYTSPEITNKDCCFDFDILIEACRDFHIEITKS